MTRSPQRFAMLVLLCASTAGASGARYFGLWPPSAEPRPFEPAFPGSSMGRLTAISFAPDFRWVAFSAMDGNGPGKVAAIHESRLSGDEWSAPVRVEAIYGPGLPSGEGAFSPDGRWLYFSSDRAPGAAARPRIFRSAVRRGEFSTPEHVALDLPPQAGAYYPRVLANGELSFTSRGPVGGDDLFSARPRGRGFAEPEPLAGDFNSPQDDWDLIESRDGNLRFWVSARAGSLGKTDVYYSRRQLGRWSAARNLAAVNTEALETAPALSPDDEVLFFLRRVSGEDRMFWVRLDAAVAMNDD
jgi:hypothetical protein